MARATTTSDVFNAIAEPQRWTGGFERLWSESLDRLGAYVNELRRTESDDANG